MECSEIDIGTVREAISALQLEADGIVKNVRRDPSAIQKGFDFLIDGGPRGDETHLEIKNPVGSEIKKANELPPSVTKQGKKIEFKIRNQLNYWFNPETDITQITKPESRDNLVVAVDCFDVPVAEKPVMEAAIEFGLKNEHTPIFFNNIQNR
jgi:hypothetical protein